MFFQKFRFYLLYSLILFLGVLPSAYAEDAIVSSVNPKEATAGKLTTFTVSGTNLHKSIRLDIDGCVDIDSGSTNTRHYGKSITSTKITYQCTPAFFPDDVGGNKKVEVRDTSNGKKLYSYILKVSKKSIYYPKTPTVTAPDTAKIGKKVSISVKIGTDKDGDLVQVRCGIERSQYDDNYPYTGKAYQSPFKTGGSTITINDVVFGSLGNAIVRCVSFDKSGKGSGVGSASIDITKTGKPDIDLNFSRDPEITLSPYEENTSIKWTVTGAKSYSIGIIPKQKYVTLKEDSNLLEKGTIKISPKADDVGTTIFTVTACDRFDKENCDSEKVTVNVIGKLINGQCGSAHKKIYEISDHSYKDDKQCSKGISSNPTFPDIGKTVSWSCLGKNGGENASCSASRKIAPIEASFVGNIGRPIDAFPTLINIDKNGKLLKNSNKLITEYDVFLAKNDPSRGRYGLVTDGNARLFIHAVIDKPNVPVTFKIKKPEKTNARLFGLNDNNSNNVSGENSIFVLSKLEKDGNSHASAILRAGKNLLFKNKNNVNLIEIEVCIPSECKSTIGIVEKTAPIILIHGLWADNSSWGDVYTSGLSGRLHKLGFKFSYFEYDGNNGPSIVMKNNNNVLYEKIYNENIGICSTDENINSRNFACTKIDVVAHSMGGLIAKKFIHDNDFYKNKMNYNQGSINKLITVGTPHLGSPLANILLKKHSCVKDKDKVNEAIDRLACLSTLSLITDLEKVEDCIDKPDVKLVKEDGGIGDILTGNDLLKTLNNSSFVNNVSTFALYGDVGNLINLNENNDKYIENLLVDAGCATKDPEGIGVIPVDGLFGNNNPKTDGIVSINSATNNSKIDSHRLSKVFHVGMGTNDLVEQEIIKQLYKEF